MARGSHPGRLLVVAGLVVAVLYALVALGGEWTPRPGVESGGGTRLVLAVPDDASASDRGAARDVLAERLDEAGVAGARVRTSSEDLVVEVPQRTDSGVLETLVRPARLTVRVVARAGAPSAGDTAGDTGQPATTPSSSPSASAPEQLDGGPLVDDPVAWASRPDGPSTEAFAAATCPSPSTTAVDPGRPLVTCDDAGIAYLLSAAVVDGDDVDGVEALLPGGRSAYALQLDLDRDGTEAFATMTRALAGTSRQFALIVDGEVVATPTTSLVPDGRPQISTDLGEEDAEALAAALRPGALPVAVGGEPQVAPLGAWLPPRPLGTGVAVGAALLLLLLSAAAAARHGVAGVVVPAVLVVGGAAAHAGLLLLARGLDLALTLPAWVALAAGPALLAGSAVLLLERARAARVAGASAGAAVERAVHDTGRLGLAAGAVVAVAGVVLLALGRGSALDGVGVLLLLVAVVDVLARAGVASPLAAWVVARPRTRGSSRWPGATAGSPPAVAPPAVVARARVLVPVALGVVAVAALGLLVRPLEADPDLGGGSELRAAAAETTDTTDIRDTVDTTAAADAVEEVRSAVGSGDSGGAVDGSLVAAAGDTVVVRSPDSPDEDAAADAVRDASGGEELAAVAVGPAWDGDDTRWTLLALVVLVLVALGALAGWTGRWKVVPAALAAVLAAGTLALGVAAWSGGPVGPGTLAALGLVVVLALAASAVTLGAVVAGAPGTGGSGASRLTHRESAERSAAGASGWVVAAALAVVVPATAVLVAALAVPATGEVTTGALVLVAGALAAAALAPTLAVPLLVLLEERDPAVKESDRRALARRKHDDRRSAAPAASAGPARAGGARGPVQVSASARRQQPTRRTRAQRGRGSGKK